MTLYEKTITSGGKTVYKEYDPQVLGDIQIESEQVVAIFSALVVSMMLALADQLPQHSRMARETVILQEAVARYARLSGGKLDPSLVDIGVKAWNAATNAVQVGLIEKGKVCA